MVFSYRLNQIHEAGALIIKELSAKQIWCFYGAMGSGKTTLIKEICKQLGVTDVVSSPTFSLVNQYKTNCGKVVYHFDFYRIKTIAEVYDIGYENYFYNNHLCLVEWPEFIEELIPQGISARIKLTVNKNGRQLQIIPTL